MEDCALNELTKALPAESSPTTEQLPKSEVPMEEVKAPTTSDNDTTLEEFIEALKFRDRRH
jgi:hypothetical protein